MSKPDPERIRATLRFGLSSALRQYTSRNFHVLMSEGCNPDQLSRCMAGVNKAVAAYKAAYAEIEKIT